MSRTRRAVTAATIALAATGTPGARAAGSTNLGVARADTAAAIAALALPPGAIRSAVEPSGDRLPAIASALSDRPPVVVATRPADGSTGLRAGAQAVWLIPRRRSERIPPGARRLVVTVTSQIPANQPRQRPVITTSRVRIDRVRALLDALPLAQPGTESCPLDLGVRLRLAFRARRAPKPLAVAVVDVGGCGLVRLTIRGRARAPLTDPGLSGTASLIDRIDSALGVSLVTRR